MKHAYEKKFTIVDELKNTADGFGQALLKHGARCLKFEIYFVGIGDHPRAKSLILT